jgi:DNA-binding CsgD family transcriptional regulator
MRAPGAKDLGIAALTSRQRDIVSRRAAGVNFKTIALELGISLKTVEFHWGQIKQRLGMEDVVLISRWWWERRGSYRR